MKKLLFIIPPNISYNEYIAPAQNVKNITKGSGQTFGSIITDIPLGPISLSAYLKKFIDIEVRLLDFNIELSRQEKFDFSSFDEYFQNRLAADDIVSFSPDIIGLSSPFAPAYRSLISLANISRKLFKDVLLLGGGNFPTAVYREIFRDTNAFDAICYGEGEKPLLDLLQSNNIQETLKNHTSWVTREKISARTEFQHDFIEDLDEIPFLDYEILDIDGYDINPTMYYYASDKERNKGMAIMTSRGCPFKCIFCASHAAHGRNMRYHSIERIVQESAYLRDAYGAQTIIIQDDHFMGDRPRAYKLVERLKNDGHKLFFPNALALYALDRPFLELISQANVRQLILAVESGSARVLKEVMKKPLKLDIVRRVAKDCRDLGIYSDCNVLIGLPGETKQDIEDGCEFLKTIDADWFRINVATPLAGSEMYEICEEKNYFKEIPILGNYKKAIVETEEFTSRYIQEKSYLMNIELNFVHNANMKLGNYRTAQESFENVLKAKHDHPLAHFYISLCQKALGQHSASETSLEKARSYASGDPFWENIIEQFSIPLFSNNPAPVSQPTE